MHPRSSFTAQHTLTAASTRNQKSRNEEGLNRPVYAARSARRAAATKPSRISACVSAFRPRREEGRLKNCRPPADPKSAREEGRGADGQGRNPERVAGESGSSPLCTNKSSSEWHSDIAPPFNSSNRCTWKHFQLTSPCTSVAA